MIHTLARRYTIRWNFAATLWTLLIAGLIAGCLFSIADRANASTSDTVVITWHRPHVTPEFDQYIGSKPGAICQRDVYKHRTSEQKRIVHDLVSGGVLRLVRWHGKTVPADHAVYITSTTGPCQGGTPSTTPVTTTSGSTSASRTQSSPPTLTSSSVPSSPSSPSISPPMTSTTPTTSRSATFPSSPSSPTTATSTRASGTPSTSSTSSLAPPLTISRHRKPSTSTTTSAAVRTTATSVATADSPSSSRSALPYTGSDAGPLAAFAALLLTVGGGLAYAGRRRAGSHE